MKVNYFTEALENFETSYKEVRDAEGRWLSDDQVKLLPKVERNHPLEKEWQKRAWMLGKFTAYLAQKKPSRILDIGCGNGWLTHQASHFAEETLGIDVGKEELEQAARCFGSETVQFGCCSDWSLLPKAHYDLVFFSGSFHYFQPDAAFWSLLKSLLTPDGEIHILETQFYSKEEALKAKVRSTAYFEKLGTTVDYYNHLSWDQLPSKLDILYRPDLRNKLFKRRSPFPWVRIRK